MMLYKCSLRLAREIGLVSFVRRGNHLDSNKRNSKRTLPRNEPAIALVDLALQRLGNDKLQLQLLQIAQGLITYVCKPTWVGPVAIASQRGVTEICANLCPEALCRPHPNCPMFWTVLGASQGRDIESKLYVELIILELKWRRVTDWEYRIVADEIPTQPPN